MPPEVVFIVLIVTVGAVALLRPITKRLGDVIDAIVRDREPGPGSRRPGLSESPGLRELLEQLNARLERVEERQDFTDALLSGSDGESRRLPAPPPPPPES